MRKELKLFRVKQDMTQEEFANKMGVSRGQYSLIEHGDRNGTINFWDKLRTAYNIPESEMWALMQNKQGGK